jgi:N-terminal acetyltransferase B complex catalytic subunit
MTSLRRFKCSDLFRINRVNLDPLTETYNLPYYSQYLNLWPNCFIIAQQPACDNVASNINNNSISSHVSGYMMGKVEGLADRWHGHVSAVSIQPSYRRLGVAEVLMKGLEDISEQAYNAYFVDLYVRKSNNLAINMYKKFGYIIYRQVINYYSGEEDAYDMRKALKRDVEKKSMIPLPHPVHPNPEYD